MSSLPKLTALLQRPGLSTEASPSESILIVADVLIHKKHCFSADSESEWQADSNEDRLRKGLVAIATFELHFWQFMETSITENKHQVNLVYTLILQSLGLRGTAVRPDDMRTMLLSLRSRRRRWCRTTEKSKRSRKAPNKLDQTLLDVLDRSIFISGDNKRGTHHDVGRLPTMTERDWPRHLATRILQVGEIIDNKDQSLNSVLPKRTSMQQIYLDVSSFFMAYDSIDEDSRAKAKDRLNSLPHEVVDACERAVWLSVSTLRVIQKPLDGFSGVKADWVNSKEAFFAKHPEKLAIKKKEQVIAKTAPPLTKSHQQQQRRKLEPIPASTIKRINSCSHETKLAKKAGIHRTALVENATKDAGAVYKSYKTSPILRERLRPTKAATRPRRSTDSDQTSQQRSPKRPKIIMTISPSCKEKTQDNNDSGSSSPMFVSQDDDDDSRYPDEKQQQGSSPPSVRPAMYTRHDTPHPAQPVQNLIITGDGGVGIERESLHMIPSTAAGQSVDRPKSYIHATARNWLYNAQGFEAMLDIILSD